MPNFDHALNFQRIPNWNLPWYVIFLLHRIYFNNSPASESSLFNEDLQIFDPWKNQYGVHKNSQFNA